MWYALHLEQVPSEAIEGLSDLLEQMESVSITLRDQGDNPIFEPDPGTTPLWDQLVCSALFLSADQRAYAKKCISALYPAFVLHEEDIPDTNWVENSKQGFEAQCFGQRLWVCPSWIPLNVENASVVTLDPGLAFGSGTHPTTKLCLQWLDKHDITDNIVIDYGCGSGILALAALRLGAKKAFAIDIDDQALEATLQNANLNQLAHQIEVMLPHALEHSADLLLANILLQPLLSLENIFYTFTKPGGIIVLTGVLEDQIPLLLEKYLTDNWTFIESISDDGWALLVFSRK
ncbi:MAG: 50S ribosomal protein L11 methyltransferase [Legionellaceae bacterium]|nr:50S ribosomal protein L11 methyltransferase [Legionellaceae bacterium]